VRIEAAGIAAIKSVWESFTLFCAELLQGFSAEELKAHQAVNERISKIIRERRDPAKQVLGLAA
jgi:hypothetical protein